MAELGVRTDAALTRISAHLAQLVTNGIIEGVGRGSRVRHLAGSNKVDQLQYLLASLPSDERATRASADAVLALVMGAHHRAVKEATEMTWEDADEIVAEVKLLGIDASELAKTGWRKGLRRRTPEPPPSAGSNPMGPGSSPDSPPSLVRQRDYPRGIEYLRKLIADVTNPQWRGRELEKVVLEVLAAEKLNPDHNVVNPGGQSDHAFMPRDMFSLPMSLGAVIGCQKLGGSALAPAHTEALAEVPKAKVRYADETGWRVGNLYACLWVVVTPTVTVFRIQAERSRAAAMAILGKVTGLLGSDRYSVYDFWAAHQHPFCWAHLSRLFVKLSERADPTAKSVGLPLGKEKEAIFDAWHRVRDGTVKRETFKRKMLPVQRRVAALLDDGTRSACARTRRTCERLLQNTHSLVDLRLQRRHRADQQHRRARRSSPGHRKEDVVRLPFGPRLSAPGACMDCPCDASSG